MRLRRSTKASGHSYSLLLKDSVIYGGGRMLQKFLTALMLPLFTAFMTKADYGVIGMVVTLTTFLDVFVTLGFDVAFTRFYFDDRDTRARNSVITHVFYVDFFYPALLLGVVAIFMPQISTLLLGSSSYTIYFDIGLATLFVTNLNDLPLQLLRLERKPWTFTWFTLAKVIIQVSLSVVFLAVFHWGPAGYLGANLVASVVLGLVSLPVYLPKLRFAWDGKLMTAMLAFAVPAMLHAVSFFFLKLSDRFFLQHYWGTATVGLYTVANSLSQPLYVVGMAFRMAWPQWHFAKLHDTALHKQMVSRSSTYFMAFNAILLAMVGLYLPIVMHVILNKSFWSIGPTTFVLTVSTALYNLYYIFWIGSNVAKKNSMIPVITLIASAVNIGLNFLLVPQHGMYAAAWTTTIGFLILTVLVYFWSDHFYPIPFEWRRLSVLGAGAALTLGAGWAIGSVVGLSVYQSLGDLIVSELAVTPVLLIFPLLFWATKFFTPREAERLRSIGRRLTGRRQRVPRMAAVPAMAGGTADGAASLGRGPEYTDHLSEDDLEAEEEEAEVEAEIDLTEGGSTQT